MSKHCHVLESLSSMQRVIKHELCVAEPVRLCIDKSMPFSLHFIVLTLRNIKIIIYLPCQVLLLRFLYQNEDLKMFYATIQNLKNYFEDRYFDS